MSRFRFHTAGETHGPALVSVVEGLPAGLSVRTEEVNRQLARRQAGYGRGERMRIERDEVEILSGVRFGKTLGGPVSMLIRNRDWENWREKMSREGDGKGIAPLDTARPGHADLPGVLKFDHRDVRNVLERASARETAARVAAGTLARLLLREFTVDIAGHVLSIGKVRVRDGIPGVWERAVEAEGSGLRMADPEAAERAERAIDRAKRKGSTVGGVVEVIARGVPPGLGSFASWDLRLDGLLAKAVMSIPAIKGVEIGGGMGVALRFGNEVHDEIFPGAGKGERFHGGFRMPFHRRTNRAGGIEGGMTNGSPVVVRAAMKPIPTQAVPLRTVRIGSWRRTSAHRERSDVCAVPACSVVAESMVAIVLAGAFLGKFGGDSMREIQYNYAGYLRRAGFR
ncbi:MAG: chorismate synthase [Deltaproteobacteria bacterium GWC2_65_14]|nr:MAG: chorismate synthase [Deltaproteobacteria bacterium GWC2_65_14]